MATIIDALLVTLGLDASGMKKGADEASVAQKKLRDEAEATQKKVNETTEVSTVAQKKLRDEADTTQKKVKETTEAATVAQTKLDEERKRTSTKTNKTEKETEEARIKYENEQKKRHKELEARGKKAAETIGNVRDKVIGLLAVFTAGVGLRAFYETVTGIDSATGRAAKNIGISTDALTAWQGTAERAGGSAAGITGAMSGLSSSFQQLALTGQSSVVPYFRAVGVAIGDAYGRMRPMGDVLLDLSDKFQHMDPSRAQYLGRGMGLDEGTINVLMEGRKAVKDLLAEQEKLGKANKVDTVAAIERSKATRALAQASEDLGRKLLTALTPAIVMVTKGLTALAQWMKEHKAITAGLVTAIAALAIGLAAVSFAALISGLVAFVGVAGVVIAKVALVAAAIGSLVYIGTDLYKSWGGLVNDSKELFQNFADWLEDLGPSITRAFKNAFNAAFLWVENKINAIWEALTGKKLLDTAKEEAMTLNPLQAPPRKPRPQQAQEKKEDTGSKETPKEEKKEDKKKEDSTLGNVAASIARELPGIGAILKASDAIKSIGKGKSKESAAPAPKETAQPVSVPAAPDRASKRTADTDATLHALEQKYSLPTGLLDSVWKNESGRGQNMFSPAGAKGHFQFMPETAKQYNLNNPYNFNESADAAARMFRDLLSANKGNLPRALAAYNWGQGNLQRKGLGNAPAETRQYIAKNLTDINKHSSLPPAPGSASATMLAKAEGKPALTAAPVKVASVAKPQETPKAAETEKPVQAAFNAQIKPTAGPTSIPRSIPIAAASVPTQGAYKVPLLSIDKGKETTPGSVVQAHAFQASAKDTRGQPAPIRGAKESTTLLVSPSPEFTALLVKLVSMPRKEKMEKLLAGNKTMEPGIGAGARMAATSYNTQHNDNRRSHTSSNETHIGAITVQTQASDPEYIAKNIGSAIEKFGFVQQANYSLR